MPPSANATSLTASQGLLALHSSTTPFEVSASLAAGLRGVGYSGDYSLLLAEPDGGEFAVFDTTVPGISLGTLVPRDRVSASLARPASHTIPLSANDEDYGCLVLHAKASVGHDELHAFGLHLGTALLNAQVSEERRLQHSADVTKLGYIAQLPPVLATGDLDRILAKLMQVTLAALGGDAGAVAFQARHQARVCVHVEWGLDDEFVDSLAFVNGRGVVEHVIAQRKPLILHRVDGFPSLKPLPLLDQVSNLAVFPLSTRADRPGCIVVVNARSLDDSAMEVVHVLEALASSAIDRMNHSAEVLEREQLRQQLQVAGSIQRSLLPLECPDVPGIDVTAVCESCDDAGGDYYDFFGAGHGLGFVIGDATGHGIGAALLVTTARASLRALLGPYPPVSVDLAGVLSTLNDIAERDLSDDKFVTMFLGIYDPLERRVTYSSAGHDPPMLVFRARTGQLEALESTGLPLGMFFGLTYEQRTTEPLEPGDVLLLMTDGVTEAPNTADEQFGQERVLEFVWQNNEASSEAIVQRLLAALAEFAEGTHQRDDITMICMKIV